MNGDEVSGLAALYRASFEASPLGMAFVNSDGTVVAVNPALAGLLGREPGELAGRSVTEVAHPQDQQLIADVTAALDQQHRVVRLPQRYVRPDGDVVHVLLTVVDLPDDGAPFRLALVEDVTERRRHELSLSHAATHDPLTGLVGRQVILKSLNETLRRRRQTDALVAVMFVDLDRFKAINDEIGHEAGDAVLVEVAARLHSVVRPGDVLGRQSGDEFVLVCHGFSSEETGAILAGRVSHALNRPMLYRDRELPISASVGAVVAGVGQNGEDLLRDADVAMYEAKRSGGGQFVLFDRHLRERADDELKLRTLLSTAVEQDRVVVHYQPIVDLQTGAAVGVEALMRLRGGGVLLPPADFLLTAAAMGVLPDMDSLVLERATEQVARWNRELGTGLDLSVNVCARQVDEGLVAKVEGALDRSGLSAHSLTLELTEQVLVDSQTKQTGVLDAVASTGVRWAIDDFGTGWASLTYLRQFPISVLKVDQSFVSGVQNDYRDTMIVRSLIDLSVDMGLDCVAEGVETRGQHDALVRLGQPLAQGRLFGSPVPAEDLPRALDLLPR